MPGGDPYIPRSWGGGCTAAALYQTLRERGMSKLDAAQALYVIIRTHPDVATDPELPTPLEVIPRPDSETVIIKADKLVLDGSEVRMRTKRPAGIDVPKPAGRTDQYNWNEGRAYLRNLHHRAVATGNDKLDLVAELRVFFERMYGTDNMPGDRSLRDHVQAWREAGDYDL
jgi:hypothetical protein